MISYQESLNVLVDIASKQSIDTEIVELENSVGRILSEAVISAEASPPFDNSAMDGFALQESIFINWRAGVEVTVSVGDCLAAGDRVSDKQNNYLAVEIMTGAALPSDNFFAVVKIEDVKVVSDGDHKKIILYSKPSYGENIRRAGEDFKEGQILLEAGTQIQHQHILALATLGISQLRVVRKIKIAVASTGKELVDCKTKKLQPGQIRNSTGLYLESYLRDHFFSVLNMGIVADQIENYQNTLRQAFDEGADLFISTGAVSMGIYDFVRPALEQLGADIHFHKCAIRPGKPILFASIEYKGRFRYIFGVPGNPVSTAVGLRFFVLPFLRSLQKHKCIDSVFATLDHDVKKPTGLKCFFKAELQQSSGETKVVSLPGQASFMVSPLLKSNAWVVLPEQGERIEKGAKVEVCCL